MEFADAYMLAVLLWCAVGGWLADRVPRKGREGSIWEHVPRIDE